MTVLISAVRDNDGAVRDDYFKITVTTPRKAAQRKNNSTARQSTRPSGRSNAAPQAYAGPDRVITSSAINVSAKASDKDGNIASYQWTQTYGDRATLNGANRQNVRISNLTPGVPVFEALGLKEGEWCFLEQEQLAGRGDGGKGRVLEVLVVVFDVNECLHVIPLIRSG